MLKIFKNLAIGGGATRNTGVVIAGKEDDAGSIEADCYTLRLYSTNITTVKTATPGKYLFL